MDLEVTSLLAKLEPALGITFALNLAYIGLPRFRYRELIRDHVRRKMQEMQDIPENHCKTDWYKQIVRLGNLDDHDGAEDETAKPAERMPSEIWSKLYVVIFERHRDRKLVIANALYCATLLFLGCAHEFSYMNLSRQFFSSSYIHWWFWLTVLAALAPVALVCGGHVVVKGAKQFVNSSTKNLKITFQREAQEVSLHVTGIGQSTVKRRIARTPDGRPSI